MNASIHFSHPTSCLDFLPLIALLKSNFSCERADFVRILWLLDFQSFKVNLESKKITFLLIFWIWFCVM